MTDTRDFTARFFSEKIWGEIFGGMKKKV